MRPMSSSRIFVAVALLSLLAGGCRSVPATAQIQSPVERIGFDTARVQLVGAAGTIWVGVEIAATNDQRNQGLMDRTALPASSGMLFLYPTDQDGSRGFWMYRTRIPLDIAFIAADGRIVSIREMEPCLSEMSSECPGYAPGAPYRMTLEVNKGFFARNRIAVGDRAILPPLPIAEP